jgi:hypothetical protein
MVDEALMVSATSYAAPCRNGRVSSIAVALR